MNKVSVGQWWEFEAWIRHDGKLIPADVGCVMRIRGAMAYLERADGSEFCMPLWGDGRPGDYWKQRGVNDEG